MSISWGIRERYKFTAGGALPAWTPPSMPAVYSITYKQDPQKKPKAHTVLYFGESSDLSQESASINRVLETWRFTGGVPEDLYVFVHPMPGSSQYERAKVQHELVNDYRPHGNGY